METSSLIHVTLDVAEPAALLEALYPNGKLGGVTVPGQKPGELGQRVMLTVKVRQPIRREFTLRGVLAWARLRGPKTPGATFGVDFLPEDDSTRQRLLAFARSEVGAEATRFERRVQVELPVRIVYQGKPRKEFLADLSPGGAFVRTWDPLSVDDRVELVVRQPRSLRSLHLQGRVAWVRQAGEHPGMGIAFVDHDHETRVKVRELLGKLTG